MPGPLIRTVPARKMRGTVAPLGALTLVGSFVRWLRTPKRSQRSTVAAMTERKIRFPKDVWSAIELTAQREGISAAEVVRVGALSYAAFSLARAGDEASEAIASLFAVASEAVSAWPL